MAKYKLDKRELLEHWNDQLKFIQSSISEFDSGNEKESRRIATSLRILFHETPNSHSLISQIGLKCSIKLWSSGGLYTPSNLLSSWSLLMLSSSNEGLYYQAIGSGNGRTFYLDFEDWWNEVIFDDKKMYLLEKILFVMLQIKMVVLMLIQI